MELANETEVGKRIKLILVFDVYEKERKCNAAIDTAMPSIDTGVTTSRIAGVSGVFLDLALNVITLVLE